MNAVQQKEHDWSNKASKVKNDITTLIMKENKDKDLKKQLLAAKNAMEKPIQNESYANFVDEFCEWKNG